jgi:non-homologous end joining protein Ku
LNRRPFATQETGPIVRKLIAFDDDTFDKLKQLGRDRMATIQELADEAFADVLRKHNIPIDLKDALRKSASLSNSPAKKTIKKTVKKTVLKTNARSRPSRKPKS